MPSSGVWNQESTTKSSQSGEGVLLEVWPHPLTAYGCESRTIKKVETEELMLFNCGAGEAS